MGKFNRASGSESAVATKTKDVVVIGPDAQKLLEFAKSLRDAKKFKVGKYRVTGVNPHGTFYTVVSGKPPVAEEIHRQEMLRLLKANEPIEIAKKTEASETSGYSSGYAGTTL